MDPQPEKSSTDKSLTKKYSFSKEEKSNLDFRKAVVEYITQVVNADSSAFVNHVLNDRLKAKGKKFIISPDNSTVEVEE